MKTLLAGLISVSMLLAACGGSTSTGNQVKGAQLKFDEAAFDFGKIKVGDKVTHEYKFTNTGTMPVIISDSYATCGCTKPEWPKTPVKPGESGVIKVTFNSEGKSGLQDKQVTIVANTTPATTVVHLVGEVLDGTKPAAATDTKATK